MGGAKLAEKPEKKILNPQEKLAAITRVKEGGETKASVARDLGIPESTLRGWCKNSLRINYQSNRSSPDTDDALKLSPSGKRRSLSSGGSKKKSRRLSAISPTSTLNSSSTLAELNRLKAEYGLSRVSEYLNQPIGTSGLDAAMQGWALQMQMLLQASVAASTQDTTPSINTPLIATTSQVTSTTSTVDTSLLNSLRPSLTETSSNSLYLSSLPSFPPTTSSSTFGNFSSNLTNPFLMSYLANLNETPSSNGVPTTVAKTPKYSLSPQYQNTPKCPWRSNSPTAYVQPFASSGSSSASVSPRSRTSLNSQNLNEYYGTDEEGPIDMSTSNEDSSSDSLSLTRTNQVPPKDEPMDFSSNHIDKLEEPSKMEYHQRNVEEIPMFSQPINENGKPAEKNDDEKKFEENNKNIDKDEKKKVEKIIIKKDEGILFNELTKPEQQIEEEKEEIHGKKLESVLESVFQVTNNNTIVSLNGEKTVSNEEAVQCGEIFLKFLETAKDPNVTASQITQVRHILGNIKSGNVPKNGEQRKPKVSRK
nr:uncharacterized protein DDB_G0271670-like [Onthophagus taurus]